MRLLNESINVSRDPIHTSRTPTNPLVAAGLRPAWGVRGATPSTFSRSLRIRLRNPPIVIGTKTTWAGPNLDLPAKAGIHGGRRRCHARNVPPQFQNLLRP